MTQRDRVEREMGGGIRMGNTCIYFRQPQHFILNCISSRLFHSGHYNKETYLGFIGGFNLAFSSVSQLCLFTTSWTVAQQASLSITNYQSLLKLLSMKSVMPSNHLIFCHPILLMLLIFPSMRVFSNESVLHIRWPSIGVLASVLPMNIQDWFPLGWTG